jgi:hypothetical protein
MTAADTLAEARLRGIMFRVEGDRLAVCGPPYDLTEAMRAMIKQHKAAILDVLQAGDREVMIPSPVAVNTSTANDLERARIWREWLWDLVADGSVAKFLGPNAEERARRLIHSTNPDCMQPRDIVVQTRDRYWRARYREKGVYHRILNPGELHPR